MATAPNQPRRRSSLAKVLIGLSSFGVLVQLFYFLADYYLEGPFRGPVKKFVDQHFLLYAAVVVPSIFVFGVCLIVMVMQWVQRSAEAQPSSYRVLRPVVYVVCRILLIVVGLSVGSSAPIWWVLINEGSLRATVWSAPVVFTAIALGTERFSLHRHRSWLRPLVWGAVAGALSLLVHLLSIGWHIDLTV